MLYRPKFCCNCGEKVEREDWTIFTSRRFCALCETEYKPVDYVPRAVVTAGVVFAVFGFGSYFGILRAGAGIDSDRNDRRDNPKPVSLRGDVSRPAGTQANTAPTQTAPSENIAAVPLSEQPVAAKRTSQEAVYYCGALTKKGTPCTRRVKTKGYCWQHAKPIVARRQE